MIRFSYTPTFNDYLNLNRYALRAIAKYLAFAISLFILFCFLVTSRLFAPNPFKFGDILPATPMLIPGMLLLLAFIFIYFAAKKRWDTAKDIREEKCFSIDDSGIRVDALSFNGFIEWQHIREADFYKGLFLFNEHLFFKNIDCGKIIKLVLEGLKQK